MNIHDLPSFFDTNFNHGWPIALLVTTIACLASMIIMVIREQGAGWVLLFAAFTLFDSGIWMITTMNINENEQNTAIRAWISDTYDVDENVTSGNIAHELSKRHSEPATFVDGQGRALHLVTTVEGDLALVDAGGRELPHTD